MEYIHRYQGDRVLKLLKQFPVVVLTGPRQAGKSTLLEKIKKPDWTYLNFDQRGLIEQAIRDPDLFAKNLKTPAIIDEAQKAPNLFHSIKAEVDKNPEKKFILSGSSNFQLMEGITETLAGRAAIAELFPFSVGELTLLKEPKVLSTILKVTNLSQLKKELGEVKIVPLAGLYEKILWGGMPKIWSFNSLEERHLWFENYRTTYIERDLRSLAQVGNLEDFQKFYQSIAFQTANLLNLSNLASDIGISVPTCRRYIDILRTSYQAFLLTPYSMNIGKRLVKTPKCYFLDTGVASFMHRYESEEALKASGKLGFLFETWVLGEVKKLLACMDHPPLPFFWKPHAAHEVDLVLEAGDRLYPMEIKHAIRLTQNDWAGLELFLKTMKKRTVPFGIVWYRGESILSLAKNIIALPLEYLWH
ncbi:MAG: ATP-binding protein [Deltaproteobacteria bacterium]|nr:ATP-binding protein [Deltaproteobacteria bacterium]